MKIIIYELQFSIVLLVNYIYEVFMKVFDHYITKKFILIKNFDLNKNLCRKNKEYNML